MSKFKVKKKTETFGDLSSRTLECRTHECRTLETAS